MSKVWIFVSCTSFPHPPSPKAFYKTKSTGIFIVQVQLENLEPDVDKKASVHLKLQLKNPHGYLSAVDYPALVVSQLSVNHHCHRQ